MVQKHLVSLSLLPFYGSPALGLAASDFHDMRLPKLVLLDRDGVINHDVGAPGVLTPSDFLLTPGAGEAIGTLQRLGCGVVVVTNQSCVGRELIDDNQLKEIHEYMTTLLTKEDPDATLDSIYFCTSTKKQNDPRMKPNPGMTLEACNDFQVSAHDCVFVGDTITDLQAAQSAGVERRILVSTGYGQSIVGKDAFIKGVERIEGVDDCQSSIPESILPFFYTKNLATAVSFLTLLD